MILPINNRSASVALETLQPILNNFAHDVSPSLRPRLEQASIEIDKQLTPVSAERLKQVISRLILHFPCPNDENQHYVTAEYAAMLEGFPEDLLCAAYQHVLKNPRYQTLPKTGELIAFMEPELTRRRATKRKLDLLLQHMTAEVVA